MILIIKSTALLLALVVLIYFLKTQNKVKFKVSNSYNIFYKLKITIIGFVANFLDTFGIGSFAVIVALRSIFRVMPEERLLIGTMNVQAVFPTLVQSLIFLHFVNVDHLLLFIAVAAISLGGILSGLIASQLKIQVVRKIMLLAFAVSGCTILLNQLHLLELKTTISNLQGTHLVIFGICMFFAGLMPAFGVGYYSLVQIIIFMLGLNPILAFPIMTTACSFQMPLTALSFTFKQKFYPKETIYLALAGVVGALIAAPLISHVPSFWLKWFLLIIIIYNIITIQSKIRTKDIY